MLVNSYNRRQNELRHFAQNWAFLRFINFKRRKYNIYICLNNFVADCSQLVIPCQLDFYSYMLYSVQWNLDLTNLCITKSST